MSAHTIRTKATLTACLAGGFLAVAAVPAAAHLPGPTAPIHAAPTAEPGPPVYPEYDPRYEVPRNAPVVQQSGGMEATSIALGALGGIALAGAGLGLTLGVQRRRDRSALTPVTGAGQ